MLPFSSISGESSLSNQDSLIYLFMCCGLIGFAFCVSFFVSNFLSFFVNKLFLSSFVVFSLSSFLICISSFEDGSKFEPDYVLILDKRLNETNESTEVIDVPEEISKPVDSFNEMPFAGVNQQQEVLEWNEKQDYI